MQRLAYQGICLTLASLLILYVPFISCKTKLFADDVNKSTEQIWIGEVTFQSKTKAGYNGDSTGNKKLKATIDYNYELESTVIIKACGRSGFLHVTDISTNFYYEKSQDYTWQRDYEMCSDEGSRQSKRVSPGDSRKIEIRESGQQYNDPKTSPQEKARIQLIISPSGKYTLMAGTEVVYLISGKNNEAFRNACTGKTKKTTITSTGKANAKDSDLENPTITGNEDHRIIHAITAPHVTPLTVITEGTVAEEISDEMIIDQKNYSAKQRKLYEGNLLDIDEGSGNYKSIVTAKWHFKVKNPCEDVINQLNESLALMSSYADENLVNSGLRGEQYENAVMKKAYQQCYGDLSSDKGGGGQKYSNSMTTGSDCEIYGEEEFEKALAEYCAPFIIYDSQIIHEGIHREQCLNKHEEFLVGKNDPSIMSKYEVEAYCAEIEVLLNWLEENCPDYNTFDAREALDHYCQ